MSEYIKDAAERLHVTHHIGPRITIDVEYIRADLAQLDVEKLARALCKVANCQFDNLGDATKAASIREAKAIIAELQKGEK